jgi:hypothetical protein
MGWLPIQSGYRGQRDDSQPEWDDAGWPGIPSCYSDAQFITYELFISGIFHLIFLD